MSDVVFSASTHRGVDTRVAATCTAVPNPRALANAGSLPLGALVSPFAPAAAGVNAAGGHASQPTPNASQPTPHEPVLRRDPARCVRCAAFVSPFCAVDTMNGRWRCCFCLGDNSDAVFAAGSAGSHAAFPELTDVDAQYLMDQMGGAHVGGADTGTPPVVFVVDESMDDDECAALRKTLLGVVAGMDRTQRVGVVTYAAAVAAYDVSVTTGVATAEVLPGTKSPTPGDVRDLVDGGRVYVAPLEECAGSVDAVLSSLRPFSVGSVRRRPRCLGAALETAVALLRDAMGGVGGGRVVVCASGPATRGPGGVAADEDSELFDFEEKAAKDYVDELSITVSHDDTQLESRPNFSLFGPASHGGPLMSI